jgi:hypothetical protein
MASIEGYVDYKRREFCHAIECPVQSLLDQEERGSVRYEFTRQICKTDCLHSCHEFHAWLNDQGFVVVKPA